MHISNVSTLPDLSPFLSFALHRDPQLFAIRQPHLWRLSRQVAPSWQVMIGDSLTSETYVCSYSRCPYCNDNGVNDKRVNNIEPPGRFRRSRYFSDSPPNFNKVIAFSRRKDAPPGLIKMVEKLRELEKVSEDKKKELHEFKSIKTHELSFIDMKNKYYKLKDQYYNTIRKIRKQKNNIAEYPVIKLIIPKYKVVEITNA